MLNKFWDLKEILMTSEEMEVILETDLEGVDFLDKSNANHNSVSKIKDQSKLKLPLWISTSLRKKGWLSITPPKYLTQKFYNLLQADPVIADLRSKTKYFYDICLTFISIELSNNVNNINNNERNEIQYWKNWQKCLITTVIKRHFFLLQNSFNVLFENQKILKMICNSEKEFYEKLVNNNKKTKYYIENYLNNNNSLENEQETKVIGKRRKTK